MDADFTHEGRFGPMTQMFRAIRAWVRTSDDSPRSALSIDRNPELDAILLERWPALGITAARYPAVDCQKLPMPDGAFDVVYSNQVLEHVPRPWLAGEQLVRVLRPGGIGIHTSCAFNPRHGPPQFEDYWRFLPPGLAALFEGVEVLQLAEWGNREAIRHNVTVDDGFGAMGGRRFDEQTGSRSDGLYPWVVWIIFRKKAAPTGRL
jgi:SAM-dependent methyltransferase